MAVGGKATAHGAALLPGHPVTPCSQIFVRTALDGPKEWTILEMQGEFEAREAGQELNNLEIGTLTCKGARRRTPRSRTGTNHSLLGILPPTCCPPCVSARQIALAPHTHSPSLDPYVLTDSLHGQTGATRWCSSSATSGLMAKSPNSSSLWLSCPRLGCA